MLTATGTQIAPDQVGQTNARLIDATATAFNQWQPISQTKSNLTQHTDGEAVYVRFAQDFYYRGNLTVYQQHIKVRVLGDNTLEVIDQTKGDHFIIAGTFFQIALFI